VYWLNKPAIVRNDEIEAIRGFLVEHQNVRVEKRTLSVNDVVKVTAGPLMQYEGNVIAIKNKTIKILLPSLGYMMVAEVEKKNVKIVNKADRFGQDKDERGRKRVNGR
jgi:transcription antitermination factor NusG